MGQSFAVCTEVGTGALVLNDYVLRESGQERGL